MSNKNVHPSANNAPADYTQAATAAKLFTHLPITKLKNPMRVIDHVHFLVGMEFSVANIEDREDYSAKNSEKIYDRILESSYLDIYRGDFLVTVMHQFIFTRAEHKWSGSTSELLLWLNSLITEDTQNSKGWPQSESSMVRRLIRLHRVLRSEQINLKFGPGKNPTIFIEVKKHRDDDDMY